MAPGVLDVGAVCRRRLIILIRPDQTLSGRGRPEHETGETVARAGGEVGGLRGGEHHARRGTRNIVEPGMDDPYAKLQRVAADDLLCVSAEGVLMRENPVAAKPRPD